MNYELAAILRTILRSGADPAELPEGLNELAPMALALGDAAPSQIDRLVSAAPALADAALRVVDVSWIQADWLTRTYAASWMRLAPALADDVRLLAAMAPVRDLEGACEAGLIISRAADYAPSYRLDGPHAVGALGIARLARDLGVAMAGGAWPQHAKRSVHHRVLVDVASRTAAWAVQQGRHDDVARVLTELHRSAVDAFLRLVAEAGAGPDTPPDHAQD